METTELLIWHDALGTDDEQATEEEVLARLLFRYSEGSNRTGREESSQSSIIALQLVQALVAFTRMIRNTKPQATDSAYPSLLRKLSVVMSKRRFFVQEVEPRIFMALSIPSSELHGTSMEHVHQTALEDLYEIFRLFYGSIGQQLRQVPPQSGGRFPDGMDMLQHIAVLRKRLRKISIVRELQEHEGYGDDEVMDKTARSTSAEEEMRLGTDLRELLEISPSFAFQGRCQAFFPKMIRTGDLGRISLFHSVKGVSRCSLDRSTLFHVQSHMNTLRHELHDVLGNEGLSLFYKGNVVWSSMDVSVLLGLLAVLQRREQDGMDFMPPSTTKDSINDSLWISTKYEDPFSPIWSSKTAYAECVVTRHVTSHPRQTQRSIHKCTPSSLSTLVSEVTATDAGKSAIVEEILAHRSRYDPEAPVYRNRGFLTAEGYFLPSWELVKPGCREQVWSPTVHMRDERTCRVVVYHEQDITMVMLVKEPTEARTMIQQVERIGYTIEKLASAETLAKLLKLVAMPSVPSSKSTSGPSIIRLNHATKDLSISNVPRLVKSNEADVFPAPAPLLAHYIPTKTLRMFNEAHETLHSDPDTKAVRIKTVRGGWIVGQYSRTYSSELYALMDTKTSSLADLDETVRSFS